MKTTTQSSIATRAAAILLAALGLGAGTAAQANGGDVYWSVGMSQPGVSIGVSNYPSRPVLVHAPRVYVPAPAPVVVYPQPVYRAAYPVYYGYGHGHRHGHGHGHWRGRGWGHEHHDRREERHEFRHDHGGHDRGGERREYGHNRMPPPMGRY